MNLLAPLTLASLDPVGRGAQKLVFRHPDDPRVLVKVVNPDFIKRHDRDDAFYKRRRRIGHYRAFEREVREHLASRARHAGRYAPCRHLQNILGMVDTDLGAALLVEAVLDDDGHPAPSLADLLRQDRFGRRERQALDSFTDWALTSHVLINDLSPDNLVWHQDGHFVLIDGMGDRAALPIRSHSQWLNRRYKRRKIDRLRQRVRPDEKPARPGASVAVALAIVVALLGVLATQIELLLE